MLQQFAPWIPIGVFCGESSPVGGTPWCSRGRTPFPEQQEKKYDHNPHSLSHCTAEGNERRAWEGERGIFKCGLLG